MCVCVCVCVCVSVGKNVRMCKTQGNQNYFIYS